MSKLSKLFRFMIGYPIFAVTNKIDLRYIFPLRCVSNIFENLRMFSLRVLGAKIGKGSYIRKNLFISNPQKLRIGSNTILGRNTELYLSDEIVIGDNVEIGSGLIIHTAEHLFSDHSKPLGKQGSKVAPVKIGDGCYFGSRVTLVSGVEVGAQSLVAAGSVVAKSIPEKSLYGGVPAKLIRELK